jgi:hypothetical protein
MATFFKTPAPPGVVVRAEHLFVRRASPAPLLRAWRVGANGRPTGQWTVAGAPAARSAGDPGPLALAS